MGDQKILRYSMDDVVDAIIRVRSTDNPNVLERYTNKWLSLDNDAVLTAVVENRRTPYKSIEKILEKKIYNLEMVAIASHRTDLSPEVTGKIRAVLEKNKERYTQPFLPGYGRRSGGSH